MKVFNYGRLLYGIAFALPSMVQAETVISGEFYLDNASTSTGAGTPFTIPVDYSGSLQQLITLPTLSPGIHQLYIRLQDDEQNWSPAMAQSIVINTAPQVELLEGQINQLNGIHVHYHNGNQISTPTLLGLQATRVQKPFYIGDQSEGSHHLGLTSQDAYGNQMLFNQPITLDVTRISGYPIVQRMDYQLNTQNPVSFNSFEDQFMIASQPLMLAPGDYTSRLQAQDNLGEWTYLASQSFAFFDHDLDLIDDRADPDDDNDGVPDLTDKFPLDKKESADFDQDGLGDNADPDDDNDGIPDSVELANGLNPFDSSDALLDSDQDGYSNLDEYLAGTDLKNNKSYPSAKRFVSHDFDGDGKSDLFWRHATTGLNYWYQMNGLQSSAQKYINTIKPGDWIVAGVADFNGDLMADILWRNTKTGQNYLFFMQGNVIASQSAMNSVPAPWNVAGVGDFDGDGKADILWRHPSSGENWIYLMNGKNLLSAKKLNTIADMNWKVAGIADFDQDGKADILWRHALTGSNYLFTMNGHNITHAAAINTVSLAWQIVGLGDFNQDGKADIVWRNSSSGIIWAYLMNGSVIQGQKQLTKVSDTNWKLVQIGDLNGDGYSDLIWRNTLNGYNFIHLMQENGVLSYGILNRISDLNWQLY